MATQLIVKVKPELDQKEFEAQLQKALRLAESALKIAEAVQVSIEADSSSLDKVTDAIAALSDEQIKLNADGTEAMNEINKVAKEWDSVKNGANEAYNEQFAAVAKLAREGKQQTEEYEQAIALLRERKQAVDDIAKAEAKVTAELQYQNDVPMPDASESAVSFLALNEALGTLNEGFNSIVEKGSEFAEAQKALRAQTGATAEEMSVLKDQAREAFVNGVGESASDAIKVIGQAKQTVGKFFEGDELNGFILSASNAGKAFDVDVNEVLQKSQGFIQAFGLNADEAGNLLTLAMRDGKVAAGDVLDTIQEYPLLMKQAGLSAEEFIGIMTRGSEAGSFTTDKIADAIKETQIRLNAGDIDAALAGLANVPKGLQDEIAGIAKAAKAGEISVKDLMFRVTEATENAVKEGTISEQLRSQIQVGISGSPAEELGTELYAKLFGAPINTDEISAKASNAAAIVQESFNPSITDKITKQLTFLQEQASAALLPLAKGAQALTAAAPQLAAVKQILPDTVAEAFEKNLGKIATQAKDTLAPALKSLGPALSNPIVLGVGASVAALTLFFTQTERGQEIWDNLSDGATKLYETVKPALTALGDLFSEVFGFVVEDVIGNVEFVGESIGLIIDKIVKMTSSLSEFFGLSTEGEGLQDTVTTLEGAFSKVSITIRGVSEAFTALREGALEILSKLLDGDITGALSAASNLGDKVGNAFNKGVQEKSKELRLEGLQKQVEAGFEIKGNLDKNNRLKELADNYAKTTDTVKKQNIAEVIGREFGVAAEEAGKFAEAQEQALTGQLQGSQKAFVTLLKEQGDTYLQNKGKAEQLRKEIVAQAIAGKDVTKLTEEYNKVSEATEESRKALEATVEEGKGLGITSDNLEEIAKQAGLSAEEAAKMAGNTKKFAAETNAAKQAARDLAAEWNKAKSDLDNAISGSTAKLSQMAKEGGRNTDEFKKLVAETRAQVKQREAAAKTEEQIQKITGQIKPEYKTIAELIQLAYDKRAAALDVEEQIYGIAIESTRLAQGRERNAGDEAAIANKTLDIQLRKRQALLDELAAKKAVVNEANGEFTIQLKGLKKEDKDNFENQLEQLSRDISASQNLVVDIRLQAKLDDQAFAAELRAFEREQVQLDIELGFATPNALADLLDQEISSVDSQIADLRKKITPELDDETVKQYKRQLLELIRSRQGFEREKTAIIDEQKAKEIESLRSITSAELDEYDRRIEQRLSRFNASFALEQQIKEKFNQDSLADATSAIDKETQAILEATDERLTAELAALDRTNKAGILSQRDYDEQKITLTKRLEAEKLRIEEEAAEQRERLAEAARQRTIRLEAEASAKQLISTAVANRKRIDLEIEQAEKEISIAKSINDAKAVEEASVRLEGLKSRLEEEGNILNSLAQTLGEDVTSAIASGIGGDDQAFDESYRKIFGKLAGALKSYLAGFVLEIILSSPMIKSAIAATGFLAPVTTAAIYGTVYAGVNALASPIIDGLTSFATGGRIDQPTLAVIGDAARLGGNNREWVTNDKQLQTIVQMSASASAMPLIDEIRAMRYAFESGIIVGELSGNDLLLSVKAAEQSYNRRLR
jgi:phage-related minor tail protein